MFYSASVNSACFYESRPQFGLSARSDNNTISLWSTSNDLNQWVKPHPVRLFCRGRLQWFLTFPEWPGKEFLPMIKILCPLKKEEKLTIFPYWFTNSLTTWIFTICDQTATVFYSGCSLIGNCKQTAEMMTNCLSQKTSWIGIWLKTHIFFTVGC